MGPLFVFGYGLSYSRFAYSALSLDRAEVGPDDRVRVSVAVTNSGRREADEVVQLYLRDPLASVARPVAELRGFARVTIPAGATRRVTFTVSPAHGAIWSRDGWRIEAGRIELMVGASSADIRARGMFTVATAGRSDLPAAAIPVPVEIV